MSDKDLQTAPPEQHLHDIRAVRDMGNLHLQTSADEKDRPWSVLRLAPAPHSGSATLIGGAIDGKTGQLIEAATGKPVAANALPSGIILEGSWTAETRIAAPRGKQRGQYKWTEPLEYRKRSLEPKDIYRPFAKGGVVLCRHNPKKNDATQFDSVSLLPTGWEDDVRPAFEAIQKNKALSSPPKTAAQKASLRALLTSDNSILASVAFRSLIETGDVDEDALQQGLSKAAGYRRAVFMYVSLVHPQDSVAPKVAAAVTRAVQTKTNASERRAVALASVAAALFHPELTQAGSMKRDLLGLVRSHSASVPAKQKPDPYVEQLLKLTQAP